MILDDHRCNVKPNSVSGHYLFYCFTCAALFWVHCSQTTGVSVCPPLSPMSTSSLTTTSTRLSPLVAVAKSTTSPPLMLTQQFWRRVISSPEHALFTICFTGFFIFAGTTLSETIIYGYHSLRQAAYGLVLAAVCQLLVFYLLSGVEHCITSLVSTPLASRSSAPTAVHVATPGTSRAVLMRLHSFLRRSLFALLALCVACTAFVLATPRASYSLSDFVALSVFIGLLAILILCDPRLGASLR